MDSLIGKLRLPPGLVVASIKLIEAMRDELSSRERRTASEENAAMLQDSRGTTLLLEIFGNHTRRMSRGQTNSILGVLPIK